MVRGRKAEGKKTYCAFIDVKKAYDRVWRDGLWVRLWEAGVRGKMWRVIRNMYKEVKSCVMVDGEQTDWFETHMGVRQGCVISPILYSVFINGFAKELIGKKVGGVNIGEEVLNLLLFADDIVLFADDGDSLQRMLVTLEEYCRKWRFEVKVMVCGGEDEGERWYFEGKEMERVPVYKYVGVMVNEKGTWDSHASFIKERSRWRGRQRCSIGWAVIGE